MSHRCISRKLRNPTPNGESQQREKIASHERVDAAVETRYPTADADRARKQEKIVAAGRSRTLILPARLAESCRDENSRCRRCRLYRQHLRGGVARSKA